MRVGILWNIAVLVATSAFAQAPALVELSDARFGVGALGPKGSTLTASSVSAAAIRGSTVTISITAVAAPATGASLIGAGLTQRSLGPWTCTENLASGRCAKTIDGGAISVTVAASNPADYRRMGGLELVRQVGDSAHGFRPSPRPSPGLASLPACDAYLREVQRFIQCPKVPEQTKDAAWQAVTQMEDAFRQVASLPPEAQKQAEAQCTQADNALRQSAAAMGCPL